MTSNTKSIVRTLSLSAVEDESLKQVSRVEHLDEEALLVKFVRDGLARYRLAHAIRAYRRGSVTLSQAARYANVSVEDMMNAMEEQGVYINVSTPQFLDGLESLANAFGGSSELYQVIHELRRQDETS